MSQYRGKEPVQDNNGDIFIFDRDNITEWIVDCKINFISTSSASWDSSNNASVTTFASTE